MLADFYIPKLSNVHEDRHTEKSFSGSNFVQKFGPF